MRCGGRSPARSIAFLVTTTISFPVLSRSAPSAADRFRATGVWLVLAGAIIAIVMAVTLRVRVDPHGTTAFNLLVATLLLVSRMWWDRKGHRRVADAFGTVAVAGLGGMVCGAVAMLELRLHFPIVDGALREFDLALGVDGLAIIDWQLRQGDWLFALMRPAYNFTLQMFFVSMVVLALLGDRVEAWRGAFCFVGTLLTTCLIAIFMPAKGLAVWATPELFSRLPERAMRSFWPRFDDFYFGFDPVLRVQVIDGVISFPSFHAIVGFLTFAMWRKRIWTLIPASAYLGILLLSTLPGGGHYIVDLLGGFGVWAAWFTCSRYIEDRIAGQAVFARI